MVVRTPQRKGHRLGRYTVLPPVRCTSRRLVPYINHHRGRCTVLPPVLYTSHLQRPYTSHLQGLCTARRQDRCTLHLQGLCTAHHQVPYNDLHLGRYIDLSATYFSCTPLSAQATNTVYIGPSITLIIYAAFLSYR